MAVSSVLSFALTTTISIEWPSREALHRCDELLGLETDATRLEELWQRVFGPGSQPLPSLRGALEFHGSSSAYFPSILFAFRGVGPHGLSLTLHSSGPELSKQHRDDLVRILKRVRSQVIGASRTGWRVTMRLGEYGVRRATLRDGLGANIAVLLPAAYMSVRDLGSGKPLDNTLWLVALAIYGVASYLYTRKGLYVVEFERR